MNKKIRKEGEGITTFGIHSDVGLAAALMSSGHELIDMHKNKDCECPVFHFEATSLVEQDAKAYEKGKLSVNAKQHSQAFNYILDRLYGVSYDED
ncbi:MAG: hypothetical protein WC498_03695 [Candidatus Saccharimonadales bacterium]